MSKIGFRLTGGHLVEVRVNRSIGETELDVIERVKSVYPDANHFHTVISDHKGDGGMSMGVTHNGEAFVCSITSGDISVTCDSRHREMAISEAIRTVHPWECEFIKFVRAGK